MVSVVVFEFCVMRCQPLRRALCLCALCHIWKIEVLIYSEVFIYSMKYAI